MSISSTASVSPAQNRNDLTPEQEIRLTDDQINALVPPRVELPKQEDIEQIPQVPQEVFQNIIQKMRERSANQGNIPAQTQLMTNRV